MSRTKLWHTLKCVVMCAYRQECIFLYFSVGLPICCFLLFKFKKNGLTLSVL